jgi:hypothetical protein
MENKMDFFEDLIKNGILITSGLDKDFNSYRIFKYREKKFRITLTEE